MIPSRPSLDPAPQDSPLLHPWNRATSLGQASLVKTLPPPLAFLRVLFSGWVNRRQQDVIDYLIEENRIFREQLSGRRLRLTDDQWRRLA